MYSLNGQYPTALTNRIRLSNGLTRTDSATFTAEEIADAGYTSVTVPTYDPESEAMDWNGTAFVVRDLTAEELQARIPPPDWNGLYQALRGSAVYQHLSGLALQYNPVDSALDKTIASISYGERYPSSEVELVALQSAVNLLLYALGLVNQTLSVEQVAEIRAALDENGFEGITL